MPHTRSRTRLILWIVGIAAALGVLTLADITYDKMRRPSGMSLVRELNKTGAVDIGQAYDGTQNGKMLRLYDGYRFSSSRTDGTGFWSVSTETARNVWDLANSDHPAIVTRLDGKIIGVISAYKNPFLKDKEIIACDVTGLVTGEDATTKWHPLRDAAKAHPGETVTLNWIGTRATCLYRTIAQGEN